MALVCSAAGGQTGADGCYHVDYAEPGGRKNPYVLINPKIIVADGPERTTGEGC